MLYAKKFFASFFFVLGLSLITISVVGAGRVAMADWGTIGEGDPQCTGAGCKDANDPCGTDDQVLKTVKGKCDTTITGCDGCGCGNVKLPPEFEGGCLMDTD